MEPEEELLGEGSSHSVFILALAHVQKKHLKAKAVREPAEGKSLLLSCIINSCKWQELEFATHVPCTAPGSQPTPGHPCCPAEGLVSLFSPCPGSELPLPSQGSGQRGWDPARQSICSTRGDSRCHVCTQRTISKHNSALC